jgi:hypothetical protein
LAKNQAKILRDFSCFDRMIQFSQKMSIRMKKGLSQNAFSVIARPRKGPWQSVFSLVGGTDSHTSVRTGSE